MDSDDPMYSGDEEEKEGAAGGKKKKRAPRRRTASAAAVSVTGIEFAKFLELCLSKLLVGTDSALRTHLVELKVIVSVL